MVRYFASDCTLPSLTSFRIPLLFLVILPSFAHLPTAALDEDFLCEGVPVRLLPRLSCDGHDGLQDPHFRWRDISLPKCKPDCKKYHKATEKDGIFTFITMEKC